MFCQTRGFLMFFPGILVTWLPSSSRAMSKVERPGGQRVTEFRSPYRSGPQAARGRAGELGTESSALWLPVRSDGGRGRVLPVLGSEHGKECLWRAEGCPVTKQVRTDRSQGSLVRSWSISRSGPSR